MMATLMACLKRALGRRHPLRLARIDGDGVAKRTSDAFEARFSNVVAVRAVKRLDMQREPAIASERLEKLAHELSVESADLFGRKLGPEDKKRTPRHVERDPGQGLVHWQETMGVTGQTLLVAKPLGERLAERDANILDCMMIVDMAIALGPNLDVDQGMARQLIEHVIEKTDASRDIGKARPIEVDAHLNAR